MTEPIYYGDCDQGEIEIVHPDIVFQNQYITVYNDTVRFPDRHIGTYLRISTQTQKSVAILPISKSGKVILIKTFRHGARGWGLEIPKGGVEENEDILYAAKRELLEETGYSSENWKYIGSFNDSPAIVSGQLECYAALDCESVGDTDYEDTEAISSVLELSVSEYFRKVKQVDFIDALTELMLYKYNAGEIKNE